MKKKILVTAYSRSSFGHLLRAIAIAKYLENYEYDILFECSHEMLYLPESYGLNCVGVFEIGPKPVTNTIEDLKVISKRRIAGTEYISRCLREELLIIDDFKPDCIIHDMRITTGIAASMRNIVSLSIHNIELFDYPLGTVLPIALETLEEMGISEVHRKKILGDIIIVSDFSRLAPMNAIPKDIMSIINEGVEEVRYTGPILLTNPNELKDKASLKKKYSHSMEPLIYITLGGSPNNFETLLKIINTVKGVKANYIIAAGSETIMEKIKATVNAFNSSTDSLGAIVLCMPFFKNNIEVIKAADLCITHGGHGTVFETISCRTPLIVIPQNDEQRENGRKSVKLGCGILIETDDISQTLHNNIKKMLQNKRVTRNCYQASERILSTLGVESVKKYLDNIFYEELTL